jgi:hypothetical protein
MLRVFENMLRICEEYVAEIHKTMLIISQEKLRKFNKKSF